MATLNATFRTEALQAAVAPTENIGRLIPYVPGKPVAEVERELGITGIIKLASNENSLGPAPRAIEAIRDFAGKMHIYPDANSHELRVVLAQALGVEEGEVVFGNGSDDIIHLLGITFLQPGDEVIQAHPSFVRYEAAAILNQSPCHLVPLTTDWVHDLDAMAERINANTRIVFITNPNNPTGTIVSREALERFLDRVPDRVLVVLDEAYFEYADGMEGYVNGLDYVREGRNVVVLRTFSKAYGLAGLRIGYGVMPSDIAGWLERSREPFNVNYMAQVAAVAALSDTDHVAQTVAMNEKGKETLYAAFAEMGLEATPTHANFIWVDTQKHSRAVFNALLHEGVIVRTGDIFGAPNHIRVTLGTEAENQKFLSALRKVLSAL